MKKMLAIVVCMVMVFSLVLPAVSAYAMGEHQERPCNDSSCLDIGGYWVWVSYRVYTNWPTWHSMWNDDTMGKDEHGWYYVEWRKEWRNGVPPSTQPGS